MAEKGMKTESAFISSEILDGELLHSEEYIPLMSNKAEAAPETKVYKRRWAILALYVLLAVLRSYVSLTFASIVGAAEIAFSWTQSDLGLLTAWSAIVALFAIPACSWIVNSKGLRISHLLAAFSLVLATALKCVTSTPPYVTCLTNVAHIFAALAGVLTNSMASRISCTWFPVEERTLATSIGVIGLNIGAAVSYAVGPSIVNVEQAKDINTKEADIATVLRAQIMTVNYVQCALCSTLFIVTVMFFQDRPPKPPSVSSNTPRYSFKTGFKIIATQRNFWLIGCSFAVISGTMCFFPGVIGIICQFFGMTESFTTGIGASVLLLSFLSSITVARLADLYIRSIKQLVSGLIIVNLIIGVPFTVYCLTGNEVRAWGLALVILAVGGLFPAIIPLLVEYACDVAYPVDEATTFGLANWMANLVEASLYLALILSGDGILWIFVTTAVLSIIILGLICLAEEDYRRYNIDR